MQGIPDANGPTTDLLQTMMKPDGVPRVCTAAESARVWAAWTDTLAWLRGEGHELLEHRAVVGQIARAAGLRSPGIDAYDIRLWSQQARTVPAPPTPSAGGERPLSELVDDLIATLGFVPAAPPYIGPLTPAAIELLYADTSVYYNDPAGRAVLTPALLAGPVRITYWDGANQQLALAVKFVVREVLTPEVGETSLPSSRTRNLVHIDAVTGIKRLLLHEALGLCHEGVVAARPQ